VAVAMDESRASVDALGDRSGDVLADLRGALDRLHGLDPAAFRDGDTLIGLLREASRVEALACARAAAFASSDAWMPVGAQTAAAWIAVESRCDPRQVKARLRRGHALTRMDLAGAAFAAGTISVEHVDRLSRARNPRTAMVFDRDEALLVGWAKTMYFDDFVTAVDAWFYRADEDRAERLADKQHRGRRLHLSRSLENTWYLNGVFDPISGQIIHDVLARIERELFEADWAEARDRLGCDPTDDDLGRTAAQRRADAMVEMATRAATTPRNGQRPKPLFTVLVGVDMFARTCELASGTFVTPGSAARWLDRSMIERIVFDGPERVLSVGHQRAFAGALRRAIEVRDRTCQHPYCNMRADGCEVDHIVPWPLGGPTSQDNGNLRCGFHNRWREPERIRRKRRTRTRAPGRSSAEPEPEPDVG
jgi:hypothetical protein